MDDTATHLLPPEYTQAADYLQQSVATSPVTLNDSSQQLITEPKITIGKGHITDPQGGHHKDIIKISVKSPDMVKSAVADATDEMIRAKLHGISAVRNEVILLSPNKYAQDVKDRTMRLVGAAQEAGIPMAGNVGESVLFDTGFSPNQIPDHAEQVIDGPTSTTLRTNIPTNPNNLEDAKNRAEAVAADLKTRLPEIKAAWIERIIKKNYVPADKIPAEPADKTPEERLRQNLEAHSFEVTTQQQENWTSVFIEIRSPEQQKALADPAYKAATDPEVLKNSNAMTSVPPENRAKLATRITLFEGEGLKKPSATFMKVAGSADMHMLLGKMMHHLKQAKPELTNEIDALLNENIFKRHAQWNLPADQQQEYKHPVMGRIDPDHPDTMNFTIDVPSGKADLIVSEIAKLAAGQTVMPEVNTPVQQAVTELEKQPDAAQSVSIAPQSTEIGAALSRQQLLAASSDVAGKVGFKEAPARALQ